MRAAWPGSTPGRCRPGPACTRTGTATGGRGPRSERNAATTTAASGPAELADRVPDERRRAGAALASGRGQVEPAQERDPEPVDQRHARHEDRIGVRSEDAGSPRERRRKSASAAPAAPRHRRVTVPRRPPPAATAYAVTIAIAKTSRPSSTFRRVRRHCAVGAVGRGGSTGAAGAVTAGCTNQQSVGLGDGVPLAPTMSRSLHRTLPSQTMSARLRSCRGCPTGELSCRAWCSVRGRRGRDVGRRRRSWRRRRREWRGAGLLEVAAAQRLAAAFARPPGSTPGCPASLAPERPGSDLRA